MRAKPVISIFVVMIAAIFFSGCGRSKQMRQEVQMLKTQVGGLSAEVNRLSEEQRFTQNSLKAAQSRTVKPEVSVSSSEVVSSSGADRSLSGGAAVVGGMYRTPSGFEIPATELQAALKRAGYYQGEIDGRVGSGTIAAIRQFQKENGLESDGIVGRQTWSKLQTR